MESGMNYCLGCMGELGPDEVVCKRCKFDLSQYKQPERALPLGTILHAGKYLVGRVMGQGGFGITYVGLDRTLELKIAIKEYFPTSLASRTGGTTTLIWHTSEENRENGRESFVKEARKMAKIHGIPSVVEVRDVFYENGTAYIVMDFVEGETLKDRLNESGPMDAEKCTALLQPVMTALAEAHRRGIVHRDISPDNVMIDRNGAVWLLDLGAAKELEILTGNSSQNSQMVIKHGFSPLEQYASTADIGSWTDVYAMCATIYYCVTGRLVPDAIDRVVDDNLAFLDLLPQELAEILRHGLALHKEDRIQNMEELLTALARKSNISTMDSASDAQTTKDPQDYASSTPELKQRFSGNRRTVPKWAKIVVPIMILAGLLSVFLIARPKTSGSCGDTASWSLKNGVLTISGSGPMQDYTDAEATPWYKSRNAIYSVVIEDEINRIGAWSFGALSNSLTDISIGSGVNEIGKDAFVFCYGLREVVIPDSVSVIREYAFSHTGLVEIVIPDSVSKIESNAFFDCTSLKNASVSTGTVIAADAFPETTIVTLRNIIDDVLSAVPWENNILMPDLCDVETTEDAYSLPALSTDLAREQIRSVTFMDTTADAPAKYWDVSQNRDSSVLAWSGAGSDGYFDLYIAAEGGVSAPANCADLFRGYKNMVQVNFNNTFHTENAERMDRMFNDCFALKNLDLSGFDTSKVNTLYCMLYQCESLEDVNLEGWDTTSVADMSWMFYRCSNLKKLDVSSFNTEAVTNMRLMFYGCTALTNLDISNFNTSNVTNMNGMFSMSGKLKELDLSGFNTSKVTDMAGMFNGCTALEALNVSGFNTAQVTTMGYMFSECTVLNRLDLSSFQTDKVTSTYAMFYRCNNILELDLEGFDLSNTVETDHMFHDCIGIKDLVFRSSVKVGEWMFAGCESLESIVFQGDSLGFAENAFVGSSVTIYYPAQNASWSDAAGNSYGGEVMWVESD